MDETRASAINGASSAGRVSIGTPPGRALSIGPSEALHASRARRLASPWREVNWPHAKGGEAPYHRGEQGRGGIMNDRVEGLKEIGDNVARSVAREDWPELS